jgi:hypothetical protein
VPWSSPKSSSSVGYQGGNPMKITGRNHCVPRWVSPTDNLSFHE